MNIFISHASKDKEYGIALVQLLKDIGIPQHKIVFTSKQGYGITKGENIFGWLKSKLKENPFVLYILSNNYYRSIPCLNEMGAAWAIENDYISMFVPGFDTNKKEFSEGAIDPRNIGVFLDNKEDIIGFVELIIEKANLTAPFTIIEEAVSSYMASLGDINVDEEDNVAPNIKTNFIEDIVESRLNDEELLLVKYMIFTGKRTLGDRWKAKDEIVNIKKWENTNILEGKLSSNYDSALERFKTRQYLDEYSWTEHGNPREYILKEDISKNILNLPVDVLDKLEAVVKKYQLPF